MTNSGFVECIKSNYYNDLDLFFSLVSWTFSLMVEKESQLSSLKRTAAKELLCVKDLLIQVQQSLELEGIYRTILCSIRWLEFFHILKESLKIPYKNIHYYLQLSTSHPLFCFMVVSEIIFQRVLIGGEEAESSF